MCTDRIADPPGHCRLQECGTQALASSGPPGLWTIGRMQVIVITSGINTAFLVVKFLMLIFLQCGDLKFFKSKFFKSPPHYILMKKAIVTSIFHHLRLNAKLIEYSILVSIDVWSTLLDTSAKLTH